MYQQGLTVYAKQPNLDLLSLKMLGIWGMFMNGGNVGRYLRMPGNVGLIRTLNNGRLYFRMRGMLGSV